MPAGARDPPSIALLPSVWRSLRWCKEEWPQGIPTDQHWRHHYSISACLRKVLQQPTSVLCYTGRAGEKSEQVSRYWPI